MSLLQDLGAFSNPYGTPAKGEWNLARGIFTDKVTNESVVFFFEKADPAELPTNRTAINNTSDTGGRRLAVYEYPYRDGQRVADLGRKAYKHTFDIKFWGLNYQQRFEDFISIVQNSGNQGTLNHPTLSPVLGALTVRFQDFEFMHKFDEWNAITIRATFIEDNTDELILVNLPQASPDSALRSSLQTLVNAQAKISATISAVGAVLLLPNAILNGIQARLTSISGQVSRLLGQLGSTFSSNQTLNTIAAEAAPLAGGVTDLTAGTANTTTGGSSQVAQLPPVYQVGFDAATQAAISAQVEAFISANQITPQQAVFGANQARAAITAAINEVNENFGNDGYDIMVQYRALAISIQQAVESSIATTQSLVKIYVVPSPMSLRQIAQANGLAPDRQNDIEALNPYLGSVNYVPAKTQITVPAA